MTKQEIIEAAEYLFSKYPFQKHNIPVTIYNSSRPIDISNITDIKFSEKGIIYDYYYGESDGKPIAGSDLNHYVGFVPYEEITGVFMSFPKPRYKIQYKIIPQKIQN